MFAGSLGLGQRNSGRRMLHTWKRRSLGRDGAYAVNGAADVGALLEAGGAPTPEPAARVEHQQGAVAVLDHVGQMDVGVVNAEKIVLGRGVG